MNKRYLPSQQFIARVIIVTIIALFIFGIYKTVIFFKKKITEKSPTKILVKDLVQKDSNNNSIPDWEEYLWGLDPKKDGQANKEFIMTKKDAMTKSTGISNIGGTGSDKLSENDRLSQEFFAIIVSLQESGNLDDKSMQSIANNIGQRIQATPISDIYTRNMIVSTEDNQEGINNYFSEFQKVAAKYDGKDIGKELTFLVAALKSKDPQALAFVGTTAALYRSFGEDLIKIPTPPTITPMNLSLANNYEKTAKSIEGLTEILSNPIVGMQSIINYKKYTDAIVSDIGKLSDILK